MKTPSEFSSSTPENHPVENTANVPSKPRQYPVNVPTDGAAASVNTPLTSRQSPVTAHVVLKHCDVDSPDFNWIVPGYCIPSLDYFCDHPLPPDSDYRFFGIYPSEKAAFAAAHTDHGLTVHGRAWMTFLADKEAAL